jgi:DNA-binding response OmpR family regulator
LLFLSTTPASWHNGRVRIHPGGFRLVLAGAKVTRLLPFLQAQGFNVEGFVKGSEAMSRLRAAPCHLLLFELECGDMMGVDLARSAKIDRLAGGTLLVDDPRQAGMIVSALSRGIDSYVSLPPDETIFMERLESLLLSQWGLVVTQQQQGLTEEVAAARAQVAQLEASTKQQTQRLEQQLAEQQQKLESSSSKQLKELEAKLQRATQTHASEAKELADKAATAQRRVVELTREIGVLRDQLSTMHLVAGVKTGASDEGAAGFDDVPVTGVDHKRAPPPKANKPLPRPAPTKATPVQDQATDEFRLADLPKDVDSDFGLFDVPTLSTPVPPRAVNAPGSLDDMSDFLPPTNAGGGAGGRADALADFEPLATSNFGDNAHDARTMAVSLPPTSARGPSALEEFNFDEKTPAAGVGRAVPVPLSVRFNDNDEPTSPRGHDSSVGPRPVGRPPHLDSQVVGDASRLVSIGDEEIIFLEDD